MTNILKPHDFYVQLIEFSELVPNSEHLDALIERWSKLRFAETSTRAYRIFRISITNSQVEQKAELIHLLDSHIKECLEKQTPEYNWAVEAAIGIY